MRRLLFLLIFGLGGAAILVSLGVWQVQRLTWKEALIADIEARIAAEPVVLPSDPDSLADAYLPVRVSGPMGSDYLRVLVSKKQVGAGYRIIRPMLLADGAVLIDMGFVPVAEADSLGFEDARSAEIVGNLQWPQESDSFTPAPDREGNIWFARDVEAMATALGTRPILVVRRDAGEGDGAILPMPVDSAAIPNDHLQYAITWFSLAAIWLLMTFFFLRRGAAANKS